MQFDMVLPCLCFVSIVHTISVFLGVIKRWYLSQNSEMFVHHSKNIGAIVAYV